MTDRELDAAGVGDPALREAYRRCRSLNARHGRTYFLATRLLPVERRPAVHALYGFARWADDIVDALGTGADTARRGRRTVRARTRTGPGPAGRRQRRTGVRALADTARATASTTPISPTSWPPCVRLVVTDYADYAELRGTCTAPPRSSGCRCCRSSARSSRARRPSRTRPRSGWPSS
ncbi:hypothetical protein GCM10023238_39770 [Streptomyces heliomycini]